MNGHNSNGHKEANEAVIKADKERWKGSQTSTYFTSVLGWGCGSERGKDEGGERVGKEEKRGGK